MAEKKKFFEIFRAGSYKQGTVTEADLDEIVSNFDDQFQAIPVVIFHKGKSDGLAYGWIEELKREGEKLFASFKDVSKELKEHVAAKKLRRHSVAIYKDLAGKGKYLRELAMLGAEAPAVKGMPAIEFAEGEFDSIEYSDDSTFMLDMVITHYQEMAEGYKSEKEKAEQDLADKTAEFESNQEAIEFTQRKSEFESFLDEKSEKGDLPPVIRTEFSKLFAVADAAEFNEGEESPVEVLKNLATLIKSQIEFGEKYKDGAPPAGDMDPKELAQKIVEFQEAEKEKGRIVSASEAMTQITNNKDK